MRATLSAQDLRFRSDWLALPLLRWEQLAPAWNARREYLETQGEIAAYEKDWLLVLARDFLALQGIAYFSAEGWERYRHAGYSQFALLAHDVAPSVEVAHAALHGYTAALSEVLRIARAGQQLGSREFHTLMQKALRGEPAFRREPANGPLGVPALAPQEVEGALQALFSEVHAQLSAGAAPVAVAAWAHHVLTQVRPYVEGNARAAFLLSQYVLWRSGMPGLYLKPSQRYAYYQALRAVDEGNLMPWATLVMAALQQATLYALSWGHAATLSYEESLSAFNQRFAQWRNRHDRDRSQRIMNNRYTVFDYMEELLKNLAAQLDERLKVEEGRGTRALVAKAYPDSPYYYQFTSDVAEYARLHGYYFNRGLPRGWFKLKFSLSANKKYQLVFSLHHGGHDDATLVVGAFLHFLEPLKYQQKRSRRRRARKEKAVYLFAPLPLRVEPLAFSIEQDVPAVRTLLKDYVQQALTLALSELSNEIY
jgi:hypothetical protein